jgi:predicted aconitase with swiveling domain
MGTFKATQAAGRTVTAAALVSPVPFSARYDLDRVNGVISRADHPLRGSSIGGKILVVRGVQGGVAAGWAMLALRGRGAGFAGMVFGTTNPVMVQGALAADIPVFAGIDDDFFDTVQTGDELVLDPGSHTVTIRNN